MSLRNPEQIAKRERELIDRLPLDLEHVPNSEAAHYDAELRAPFYPTSRVSITGGLAVDAATPIELKTCQRWITDRHSAQDRRRGRFFVSEVAHRELENIGGTYCFIVLDGEQLLAARLVVPALLDVELSWTRGDDTHASRKTAISWPRVVPRREVDR